MVEIINRQKKKLIDLLEDTVEKVLRALDGRPWRKRGREKENVGGGEAESESESRN